MLVTSGTSWRFTILGLERDLASSVGGLDNIPVSMLVLWNLNFGQDWLNIVYWMVRKLDYIRASLTSSWTSKRRNWS